MNHHHCLIENEKKRRINSWEVSLNAAIKISSPIRNLAYIICIKYKSTIGLGQASGSWVMICTKKLSLHVAFTRYLSSYHAHKSRYAITFHFHVLCFILFIHNVSKNYALRLSSWCIVAGIKDSMYVCKREKKRHEKCSYYVYLNVIRREKFESRWQNEIFQKLNRKCV